MFWEKFIELCNKNNTNPTAVCKQTNLSPAAATNWRKGSVPNSTTVKKIADYFQVSPDFFYHATPKPVRHKTSIKRIPVLGDVAAGIPIEAIEEWDDWEEINADKLTAPDYVALKIHGDSMEPKLENGDIVIVECGNPCKTGDCAIVLINGSEATCKKIQFMPNGIKLISLNPAYDPMFYSKKQIEELPVRIFGKVVESRRKNW